VTGATGFVGRHLVRRLLARGDSVIALSRDPLRATAQLGSAVQVTRDLAGLPATTQVDAIVNLAGAPILRQPWTAARRQLLRDSRNGTTRAVVALCNRLARRPATLVSASAVGYYGVRGDEPLDELAAPQPIFQSQLCSEWEAIADQAAPATRVVKLRLGVVMGRDGGALPQLARSLRLGLGSILGSGSQGAPWIHIDDTVRLIEFALDTPALQGPVNVVAPGHVSHAQLQRALGRVLHRPVWLPVPAFVLRAVLGEMSQLLVDGQHVVPVAATAAGFAWRFPQLDAALEDLLGGT
jgi:uncharacterized protein (TIGR01777 family)